jgi:hypothetical protein
MLKGTLTEATIYSDPFPSHCKEGLTYSTPTLPYFKMCTAKKSRVLKKNYTEVNGHVLDVKGIVS